MWFQFQKDLCGFSEAGWSQGGGKSESRDELQGSCTRESDGRPEGLD